MGSRRQEREREKERASLESGEGYLSVSVSPDKTCFNQLIELLLVAVMQQWNLVLTCSLDSSFPITTELTREYGAPLTLPLKY